MYGFRENEILVSTGYEIIRVKRPHILQLHIYHHKMGLPNTRPRLLSYCALKLVHWYSDAVALSKEINKITGPVYVALTWCGDFQSIQ